LDIWQGGCNMPNLLALSCRIGQFHLFLFSFIT
jgi:hypothetical protein